MKKILIILCALSSSILSAQVTDESLKTEINQYTIEKASTLEQKSYINELKYPIESNYYPFSEETTLELGRGFLPYHLDRIKESPYTFDVFEMPDAGADKTVFEMKLIFNRNQLQKTLDWDVKLNASAFGITASEYYHVINNSTFDESSVYLVIKSSTEFSRLSLINKKLKPEAAKLAKKDPNKFREVYGSKIASMARRYASVYIVIKLTGNLTTITSDVSNDAKLSYDGLVVSGSLESHVKDYFKSTENKKTLEVTVLTRGGTGFNKFSDLVSNLTTSEDVDIAFAKLRDGVANYLTSFNSKNSAVLGYFASDYSLDPKLSKIPNDLYEISKEKCLTTIVDKYNFAEKQIERLTLLLQKKDPYYFFLSPAEKLSIEPYIESLNKYQQTLLKLHYYLCDRSPIPKGDFNFDTVDIPVEPYISILNRTVDVKKINSELLVQGKFIQNIVVQSQPLNGQKGMEYHLVDYSDIQSSCTNSDYSVTVGSNITSININYKFFERLLLGDWSKYNTPDGAYIIIRVRDQAGKDYNYNIGRIRCTSLDNCSYAYNNPEDVDLQKIVEYCYINYKKDGKYFCTKIFKASKFDLIQPKMLIELAKKFSVKEKDIIVNEFYTELEAKTAFNAFRQANTSAQTLNFPEKTANCDIEAFCRYGIGNLCALNIKVDGKKYYKKFPCSTTTEEMKQDAIAACNQGTIDIFWDQGWGLDCPSK